MSPEELARFHEGLQILETGIMVMVAGAAAAFIGWLPRVLYYGDSVPWPIAITEGLGKVVMIFAFLFCLIATAVI